MDVAVATRPWPRTLPGSRLRGSRVHGPRGEQLGTITELVVDAKAGRVAYGVLALGDFVAARLVAVPWEALQAGDDGDFQLNLERDRLASAPGFDERHWPDFGDGRWGHSVHAYFGVEPYWYPEADDAGEDKACEVCGNVYDKAFEIRSEGETYVFDCFECAIHALAPTCDHCGCRIVGHGMEARDAFYCCAHCAEEAGEAGMRDRT